MSTHCGMMGLPASQDPGPGGTQRVCVPTRSGHHLRPHFKTTASSQRFRVRGATPSRRTGRGMEAIGLTSQTTLVKVVLRLLEKSQNHPE